MKTRMKTGRYMQNVYPFSKFRRFMPAKFTPISWFREFAPTFEKLPLSSRKWVRAWYTFWSGMCVWGGGGGGQIENVLSEAILTEFNKCLCITEDKHYIWSLIARGLLSKQILGHGWIITTHTFLCVITQTCIKLVTRRRFSSSAVEITAPMDD